MTWLILVEILGLLPMFIVLAMTYWEKRKLDTDGRREAITTELRFLPGASIQEERDTLDEKQTDRFLLAIAIGVSCGMAIIGTRIRDDLSTWGLRDSLFLLGILGASIYFGRKIVQDLSMSRRLKFAIRAEHATAQELGAALAGDNRIIHDVRAKGFNIDHVVITPAGVFAVETKSRLKPPAGNGAEAVKVRYDGKQLQFPDWVESRPIEQAARQARWLSEYLQRSTGESFPVIGVLALPGWYVENTVRVTEAMVRVINPKKSQWLLLPERQPARLDPAGIQRAAFAIEKLAQCET